MSKFLFSNKKFTGKIINRQNFNFLRSISTIFQPKSAIFSSRAYWIMSSFIVELCHYSDSKTIQKVRTGVFLEQNAATYSSNSVLHSFSFFDSTVLELITKAHGNCTEIASEQQKFKFIYIF